MQDLASGQPADTGASAPGVLAPPLPPARAATEACSETTPLGDAARIEPPGAAVAVHSLQEGSADWGGCSGIRCSFRGRQLRAIELPSAAVAALGHQQPGSGGRVLHHLDLAGITDLDLSCNELSEVPGLAGLRSLTRLDLSRNWLAALPAGCAELPSLQTLSAARNFLRPTPEALLLGDRGLPSLPKLASLDLRFNRKCDKRKLLDALSQALPGVDVRITVAFPAPEGAFVGANPCDRDPALLRSQLEPWPTLVLRRRLEQDFGRPPTDPEEVDRAEVMRRLLAAYASEGMAAEKEEEEEEEGGGGGGGRRMVRAEGAPLAEDLCGALLEELGAWVARAEASRTRNRQERPSICASSYMILRSPAEFAAKKQEGSRKAAMAARKLDDNRRLWDLAAAAIRSVDADYAARYTALAVTHGFRGSPHIDKQNVGPFYGLALGDFDEGQGGICVEVDARTVAHVNTRKRLAKVDGRYPHWVAPYDPSRQRYSLIFYQTEGQPTPLGPPVLSPLV